METTVFNVVLTPEQAQFTFEALTRSPLPYIQVRPIVEALQRAAQQAQSSEAVAAESTVHNS